MANEQTSNDDSDPSFEDALHRLADAVRQLEEGNLSLDDSLARYEEGIRYLSQCQKILENAERKIELLSGLDAEGNPIKTAVDDEAMTLEQKADERSRRRSATQEHTVSHTQKQEATRTDGAHIQRPSRSSRDDSNTHPPSDLGQSAIQEDDVDGNGRLF